MLDDRVALGLDALAAAIDRRDPRIATLDVRGQLFQLLTDQRTALQGFDADEANAAVGEVQHLQRAGILDQVHDVLGHQLLGADRHIDGERAVLVREQLRMLGEIGGADAGDARRVFVEQAPRDLAGDHVHFVAVGQRDEDVGVACAGGFEHARLRAAADQRANVETVLQIAQELVIHIDDRDFVRCFARQMVGGGATHLSGAEDDYFHTGSRFAYASISHLVPWRSKFTCTRAWLPWPSRSSTVPSPNLP